MTPPSRRYGIAALSFLATACTLLRPNADRSRYYLLMATDVPGAERPAAVGPVSPALLVVAPVRVVAYLDRNELVTRPSTDEVRYSAESRWAEPLGLGITRVLVVDLSRILGTTRVAPYRAGRRSVAAYRLTMEVSRFDVSAAGEAVLTAHWTLDRVGMDTVVTTRDSSITARARGEGGGAAVAALSATIDDLSQEIAHALPDLAGTVSDRTMRNANGAGRSAGSRATAGGTAAGPDS